MYPAAYGYRYAQLHCEHVVSGNHSAYVLEVEYAWYAFYFIIYFELSEAEQAGQLGRALYGDMPCPTASDIHDLMKTVP